MRKIMLFGLLLVTLLSACEKEDNDPAPGERPDERLNKVLSEYKAQLVGAEHGWKATLYPAGGSAYSFLFDFKENDRVVTLSDLNAEAATTPLESTYRLKGAQKPSLLFDTYTYLHILADPDETKSGGDRGQGRYSDYEFSFDQVSLDSIILTGNYHSSRLVLVRATAGEATDYISSINENIQAFEGINNFSLYFKQLRVGAEAFDIKVNTSLRTITITYEEGNEVKTFTSGYYYTPEGVTLLQPLQLGDITISTFSNLDYEASRNRIDLTVNGVAGSIQEASKPATIDTQAASRFYNSAPYGGGAFWVSVDGFTVEGVQDAFNIHSIPGFEIITLYLQVDGLLFWTEEGKYFGPTYKAGFTNDGRITFTETGVFSPTPEEAAPMVTATSNQLFIPEGYYVIQTGPETYDLVSAKDAKTWISFE